MVLQLNESINQFHTDLNFYLKTVNRSKIPTIPEIKRILYEEYKEVDNKVKNAEKEAKLAVGTSDEVNIDKKQKQVKENQEQIVKQEKPVEKPVEKQLEQVNKSKLERVKLDQYDENGWAYYLKKDQEEQEVDDFPDDEDFDDTEESFDDFPEDIEDEDESFDDFPEDFDEDEEDEEEFDDFPSDIEEDEEEEFDDFPDEFEEDDSSEDLVENTAENSSVNTKETAENDENAEDKEDDDFDDFPELDDDEDEDFPDLEDDDFPEMEEDDDDFPELTDDEDEEEEEFTDDIPVDEEEVVESPTSKLTETEVKNKRELDIGREEKSNTKNKKDSEVPIKNKSSFGGSKDESWRANSKVGSVQNLWGMSSMEPMSKKECDVFMQSISSVREKLDNDEIFSELEGTAPKKSPEELRKEAFKKRFEEKKKRLAAIREEELAEDDRETGQLEPEELENLFSADNVETGQLEAEEGDLFSQSSRVADVTEKQLEKKKESDENISYASVRDFVKKRQGCSIEEALKYFSKKDVDRELKLGRIIQKNKKLFI